jgi:restriction system protein
MASKRSRRQFRLVAVLVVGWLLWKAVTVVVTAVRAHLHLTAAVAVLVLLLAAGVVWWRHRAGRVATAQRYARDHSAATLDQLDPRQVEELVGRLLEDDGCTDVQVCGGAGDLGADVTGTLPDGRRVVVQVKDYRNPIGCPALQTFNGTCWAEHDADVAVFVTTASRFTPAALAFAERHGIVCVDHDGLAAWMTDGWPELTEEKVS